MVEEGATARAAATAIQAAVRAARADRVPRADRRQGSKSRTGGLAKASQARNGGNKSFARSIGNHSTSRKVDARLVKSFGTQNLARLEKPAHHKRVALPDKVAAPDWKEDDKAKNFHAKLGRLNSLNRNYHAYLNTQSPHFASLAAFVRASAELDLAQADLTAARDRLAAAEDDLGALVSSSGITAYDDAVGIYDDPTLADLQDRRGLPGFGDSGARGRGGVQ